MEGQSNQAQIGHRAWCSQTCHCVWVQCRVGENQLGEFWTSENSTGQMCAGELGGGCRERRQLTEKVVGSGEAPRLPSVCCVKRRATTLPITPRPPLFLNPFFFLFLKPCFASDLAALPEVFINWPDTQPNKNIHPNTPHTDPHTSDFSVGCTITESRHGLVDAPPRLTGRLVYFGRRRTNEIEALCRQPLTSLLIVTSDGREV